MRERQPKLKLLAFASPSLERGSSGGLCSPALCAFEKFDGCEQCVKGGISAMVDNCCDTILVSVCWFGSYKEMVFVIVTITGVFLCARDCSRLQHLPR